MPAEGRDIEKLRKLVKLLPGENCGKCGYDGCGAYAIALAEEGISPLTCRKSLGNIKEICAVLGVPVPENAAQIYEEHRKRHEGKHGHDKYGHPVKGEHHGGHFGKGGHHGQPGYGHHIKH